MIDLIIFIHFCVVFFHVGGLFAFGMGAWRDWDRVRNRTFRILHLGLILIITAESILGFACPLTTLENWLHGETSKIGFIELWIRSLLYWDLLSWMFVVAYSKFAALVAVSWKSVPPNQNNIS